MARAIVFQEDSLLAEDGGFDPSNWHGVVGARYEWRITSAGVVVRSGGEPETGPRTVVLENFAKMPALIAKRFAEELLEAEEVVGIPRAVMCAVICVESGGKVDAERREAHLNDSSIGVCQTLTQTAYAIGLQLGFPLLTADEAEDWRMPKRPLNRGGDIGDWRRFLRKPRNSVLLGAGYLRYLDEEYSLRGDPAMLYASFNAGSPRSTDANAWGIVSYGSALDAFVRFFGTSCALF